MSAGRYEITVDGPCVTIKEPCGFSGEYHRSEYADNVLYGAIRQQARDLEQLRAELATCDAALSACANAAGVPTHPEREGFRLAIAGEIAEKMSSLAPKMTNARHHGCAFEGWQCFHCGECFTSVGAAQDHFGAKPDAVPGCVLKVRLGEERGLLMGLRKIEAAYDELLSEFEGAVTERNRLEQQLTTANADLAAAGTRAEQAEARLAAIDNAPTVAVVCSSHSFGQFVQQRFFGSQLPRIGTELIARPAKD